MSSVMLAPMSKLPAIRRRRFGRTGLEIRVFSCGGMRYQHKWSDIPWSEVPADGQANLEATIHRAMEDRKSTRLNSSHT